MRVRTVHIIQCAWKRAIAGLATRGCLLAFFQWLESDFTTPDDILLYIAPEETGVRPLIVSTLLFNTSGGDTSVKSFCI